MASTHQGRNEMRVSNSTAKTLLENWVEERACQELSGVGHTGGTPSRSVQVHGHKGLIAVAAEGSPIETTSSCQRTYQHQAGPSVRSVGQRQEDLERRVRQYVVAQHQEEVAEDPHPIEYVSTTTKDFSKEFTSSHPHPEQQHSVYNEMPTTFWAEQVHQQQGVPGVSQIRTHDTPFRKNAAFSTPTEQSFNQAKPYED